CAAAANAGCARDPRRPRRPRASTSGSRTRPWRRRRSATPPAAVAARLTDAAWPTLDAAVTLGSLLATGLTARALLDNWVWWIVVDAASLVLYASQGLVFVALLYLVYMVIAVIGLRDWGRRLRDAPPQAAP
ncbi:MAG: nicotinamide riboside transporter PnuC, partial [Gammaproteobacteria bacterium]